MTCSSTCPATAARRGRWRSWCPARRPRWSSRCAASPRGPVRRRGMRPLVEATVADETGVDEGRRSSTSRGCVQRYPAGHAAGPARQVRGPQPLPRPGPRADHRGQPATTSAVAHYAATEGLSSTQILALVRAHAAALADVPEPLPARLRTDERLPERRSALAAVHFARRCRAGPGAPPAGLRGAAARSSSALLRRRRLRRGGGPAPALDGARELTARWLETMLPFTPTGDQRARDRPRSMTIWPGRDRCSAC